MALDTEALLDELDGWSRALGFSAWGIASLDSLQAPAQHLDNWLAKGRQGSMAYMARNRDLRASPEQLHPGTTSIISLRLDYLPEAAADPQACLDKPEAAYISRYALGRDYHKTLRGKLRRLAKRMESWLAAQGHQGFTARVATDSAPVLEKALAESAGLGWIGKNTLILHEAAGSWFFLGEILTNLPLPASRKQAPNRCGACSACINVCPTGALVAPYQLDARRCISYLTIEHKGAIAEELRPLIGNRIFGCDDCQLVCPWNRYAQPSSEPDFHPRHKLDTAALLALFAWSEAEYLAKTQGSALRRPGYQGWLRNLAVALGNALAAGEPPAPIRQALRTRLGISPLLDDHINWALAQAPKPLPVKAECGEARHV